MASAEPPPVTEGKCIAGEDLNTPNGAIQESQPTEDNTNITESDVGLAAGKNTAVITRTTSLFGPFPPANEANQPDTMTTETTDAVVSSTADCIEPSRESIASPTQPPMPALNSDPSQASPPAHEPSKSILAPMPSLTRQRTVPAIGPATDKPTPVPKDSEIEGHVLFITLLLTSTGTRHPYKLDEKYLKKRNVVVEGNNPVNISLYKLKELILRDWRDEWEAKPSSPESIRLISMGKMLNDKSRLADSGFKTGIAPHIIHMTIKPQEIVDEEDARLKSGARDRDGNERSPGCRCVIM